MTMTLKVMLPTHILIDETVQKVTVEAENGSLTLLPRHIDFVTVLVPGLFQYVTDDDQEKYLAIADGMLVKRGFDLQVSTRNAVQDDDLETLAQTVRESFRQLDERERKARSVLAALETELARHIAILGDDTI